MKSIAERFERFNSFWLKLLPLFYIMATFEHNFATLRHFDARLILFGVNLSTLSNVMLVLALDLSIYYSVQYTVYAQRLGVRSTSAKLILILSSIVSVALNVYYMIIYAPDGLFPRVIGTVVGVLIPSMLVLFGWLTGTVRSIESNEVDMEVETVVPPREQLEQKIIELAKAHPDWSNRKIARKLKCSHTTVGRIRRRHGV